MRAEQQICRLMNFPSDFLSGSPGCCGQIGERTYENEWQTAKLEIFFCSLPLHRRKNEIENNSSTNTLSFFLYYIYSAFKGKMEVVKMKMAKDWIYRRGDIYLANLNPFKGSEQGGKRPVVVLQNNAGNLHSSTLIVTAITSHMNKKKDQPTHYILPPVGRLKAISVVQLEQIKTIDKCRIMKYLGKIPPEHMKEINKIIKLSLGIIRIPKKQKFDRRD